MPLPGNAHYNLRVWMSRVSLDVGDGGVAPQLPACPGRVLHVVKVAAVLRGEERNWKLKLSLKNNKIF